MKFLRIVLLLAVALGVAWAQGERGDAEKAGVEQLSQEELDAEMRRVEEALSESGLDDSGPDDLGEVKEFIPTKPLAADLPVALPSDI